MANKFDTTMKLMYKEFVPMPEKHLINVDDFFREGYHDIINNKPVAFDFETSGLDIMADVFWARSVSFHNDEVSMAVQIRYENGDQIDPKAEKRLFEFLGTQTGLIAHNATYDCGVLMRATKKFVRPLCDTLVAFKDLSNEGFVGQMWSLDYIVENILDWPVYSKELDIHLKSKKLNKATMCHADWGFLGRYNQLDSAATWNVYKRCIEIVDNHKESWGKFFWTRHNEDILNLLKLQIIAYKNGLNIETKKLSSYSEILDKEIADKKAAFFDHPKIKKAMVLWEDMVLKNYEDSKPVPKYKANGELHGGYLRSLRLWEDRKEQFFKDNEFNLDSPKQLQWLITTIFDVQRIGETAIVKEMEDN